MSSTLSKNYLYSELKTKEIGYLRWEVLEDWKTPFCTVKAGFKTDGVSAGILRPLAQPDGSFFEAAIVHDYMYVYAVDTKAAADWAFYLTARTYGVVWLRAYAAYKLCSKFGRGAYPLV
jgi:hypothetical protein